jgi:hypothetical protein
MRDHRQSPRSTSDPAPSASLRREERRLQHAFTAILAALAPALAVQACGDETLPQNMSGADAGATPEASTDAPGEADAIADAGADGDAATDGPGKDCMMKVTTVDAGIDAEPGCVYQLPCGLAEGLIVMGCDLYGDPTTPLGCKVEEGYGCQADAFAPGPGGEVHVVCAECLGGGGRRPKGLARPRPIAASSAIGAYFARMTHDEAAAVHAFRRMRDELASHGAPASLVRAAERSARDEVRHARIMGRRARSLGASIPAVRVRRLAPRSLAAIARENAVEGCVHETFGALLLAWQAAHASDAADRETFARMAADETRHAALSWAVARWIEPRLAPRERARVGAARARAIRDLRRFAPAAPFDSEVGRPALRERAALVESLIRELA